MDQQMKLSGFLTRRKRQYGYVACMDETRIAYTTYDFVWKTCLGRTRRRYDNIKMHLKEIWFEGVDLIQVASDKEQERGAPNLRICLAAEWLSYFRKKIYIMLY